MNKILQDQVEKHFGHDASIPETLRLFMNEIDRTYQAFEQQLSQADLHHTGLAGILRGQL